MYSKRLSLIQKNISRSVTNSAAAVNTLKDTQLKPWWKIPGPSSIPFIGPLHHFMPGRELADLKGLQERLYQTYGPIVRVEGAFGQPASIFLFNADCCETILRNEAAMPIRPGFESLMYYRRYYKENKEAVKLSGLLTEQGDNWRQFRSTVNPVMLQPKTIKLYSNVLDEVAHDMIKRMKSLRGKDNMIQGQFDNEMNLWALESIGVVALGTRLHSFDQNLPEDSPEKRLILCIHDLFNTSNALDFRPSLWRVFPTKTFKSAMKLYAEQENLAKIFIRRAMKDFQNKTRDEEEKGVLEKLLEINEEVAVVMACDMLFAGVDTTGNTIIALLYLLGTNPREQKKLREELSNNNKVYLKACLKESLRLLPVVSGNMRKTTREYDLLGYKVPKDINVIFCHQLLSQIEENFPKPKEFIPERWINKQSPLYYNNKGHPFAYNPFGFGIRSCIGRRIAELEIEIFLSRIIENFQVEWFGPPIDVKPTNLNYLQGPFNFIFRDVK